MTVFSDALTMDAPMPPSPNRSVSRRRSISRLDPVTFQRAMDYLRENFPTATVRDVAAHVGLSMFYFHRAFTRTAGRTPKQVRTDLQMQLARTLLLEGRLPLPEIARQCGFAHQSHLTLRFRMTLGQAPRRWLRAQPLRQAA